MRGVFRFGTLCALWALCASVACGNVTSAPDAAIPDAPPDGPPLPTAVYRWVISNQLVPESNTEAIMFGLDLDGDGAVDNQFGAVLGALFSQGINIQAPTDTAISRGSILMLAQAGIGIGGTAAATFTMYTGANPQPAPCNGAADAICRRHLEGNARFDLAASSARDLPLAGTLANGTLVAGPGHLQVSLAVLGGTPIVLDLIGARARLQLVTESSLGQSVIAGAIPQAQIDARIYPGLQQTASAIVAAGCPTKIPPDCGCTAGSMGRTYLNLFDTMPRDCTITLDEIRNNSLIKSLFAPDLTVEGQAALSAGFAITAIKAAFAP
jgi:hypothetical protein